MCGLVRWEPAVRGRRTLVGMGTVCSPEWVREQVAKSKGAWRRAGGGERQGAPRFAVETQRRREQAYDRSLRAVERVARDAAGSDRAQTQQELIACFARFAAEALDLGPEAIELITGGFLPAGIELARWAQGFDPHLSRAGVIQATRNAWTACGLQPLLGAQLKLTPAILGYSLIYPYSDNFLDGKGTAREEKLSFSERFGRRLRGEHPASADEDEACLWQLVGLIERQYPRGAYPAVYASLLAIHRAQAESIGQMDAGAELCEEELLGITCGKGGTSVLADACLVRGSLTESEAEFAFGWGVLLQLGDDLQDLAEDLERGSLTLFTRAAREGQPLDGPAAQLLCFGEDVFARLEALPRAHAILRDLLRKSWRSLVLMAVARHAEFFSAKFAAELEAESPFRFAFLRAHGEKLTGRAGLMEQLMVILVGRPGDGCGSMRLEGAMSRREETGHEAAEDVVLRS